MSLAGSDPIKVWTFILVGFSFLSYVVIAWRSKAESTSDFYVAGSRVGPVANGMATAAGWMSAASFISMAGMMSFLGRDGAMYLMGWTGGYVLLALLLAPYLRKFGKYTVPDFVGERYYSTSARVVALVCAIFVSFTYVAGQMRGVGVVFARFLEVPVELGVVIGMAIVFIYAVLGGQKGITYTQVAQYCVLIFAYMLPTFFISVLMTGVVLPQIGLGAELIESPGISVLEKLDNLSVELGFSAYTGRGDKSMRDVFFITLSLMVGTAGLPHVITRFFTVPRVKDARVSAGWALLFIVVLYATAPAVAAFARVNLLSTVHNANYASMPDWFYKWEETGLIRYEDKNGDGSIQYYNDQSPGFQKEAADRGWKGNELTIDRDIIVLANPEIARLPPWVIALVAAGGLAAALSTAAGLLLVLSMSISHDLVKKVLDPSISEAKELQYARFAAAAAVIVAGYFGINPPGFVAQVVAFAFGLAASSFFPVIVLGIFSKRMNREGAIVGMVAGMFFTTAYIVYFKFINPEANNASNWLWGISPEGIGGVGMLVNFAASCCVSMVTKPPPPGVRDMVEDIRLPRTAA